MLILWYNLTITEKTVFAVLLCWWFNHSGNCPKFVVLRQQQLWASPSWITSQPGKWIWRPKWNKSVEKCPGLWRLTVLVWSQLLSILIKMSSSVTYRKGQCCFRQHVRLWTEKTRRWIWFHFFLFKWHANQQCIISLLNSGFSVNSLYKSVILNKCIVHGDVSVSFLKGSEAEWMSNTGDKCTCLLYLLKKQKTDLETHPPDIFSWISWSWNVIIQSLPSSKPHS